MVRLKPHASIVDDEFDRTEIVMAWIKIETNLFEKPEVVWLAKALKLKTIMVVGALVRFWSVVDGLTEDGFVALSLLWLWLQLWNGFHPWPRN